MTDNLKVETQSISPVHNQTGLSNAHDDLQTVHANTSSRDQKFVSTVKL
jgi:hypothetical protein